MKNQPMVEIGEAIRGLLMEQMRGDISGHQMDDDAIKKGNVAAHGGNGVANAQLITMGYLPWSQWSRGFQEIYQYTPTSFLDLPPKLQQTTDCALWITNYQWGSSVSDNLDPRLAVEGWVKDIKGRFIELDYNSEAFENDKTVIEKHQIMIYCEDQMRPILKREGNVGVYMETYRYGK
ncbi:hypothetical protein IFR05_013136 [Cadophora sp. M221]|nr:hypothetical protein IFR05_013136 [Cadophora sp. M221]